MPSGMHRTAVYIGGGDLCAERAGYRLTGKLTRQIKTALAEECTAAEGKFRCDLPQAENPAN